MLGAVGAWDPVRRRLWVRSFCATAQTVRCHGAVILNPLLATARLWRVVAKT
jgi:hypothetical protein